jgi:hypothetical protein
VKINRVEPSVAIAATPVVTSLRAMNKAMIHSGEGYLGALVMSMWVAAIAEK